MTDQQTADAWKQEGWGNPHLVAVSFHLRDLKELIADERGSLTVRVGDQLQFEISLDGWDAEGELWQAGVELPIQEARALHAFLGAALVIADACKAAAP